MDPGVQYNSANTAHDAAVSVMPTPAAVIPRMITEIDGSAWKLSTIGWRLVFPRTQRSRVHWMEWVQKR